MAVLVVVLFGGAGLVGLQAMVPPAAPDPAGATTADGEDCEDCLHEAEAALASPRTLRFEVNHGQAPDDVLFTTRSGGAAVWLKTDRIEAHAGEDGIAIVFPDADPADVTPRQPLHTRTHYYLGNDPANWAQNVPDHGQVVYQDLWSGVDLVVHSTEDGRLEFDHIVAPGADPDTVRFRVEGATARIEDDALVAGAFRLDPPVIYQENAGTRDPVEGRFVTTRDEVRYRIGAYDTTRPLVIDPVLHYASHLQANDADAPNSIAVAPHADPDKRIVYVGGTSENGCGTCFPTPPGFGAATLHPAGAAEMGESRAFVARMTYNVDTRSMTGDWFAYLGGSTSASGAHSLANALAHDPTGGVVLAGGTEALDFPTRDAIQMPVGGTPPSFDGSRHAGNGYDGFVTRLDETGALTFSTFLGGNFQDHLEAVAVDGQGQIAVGGHVSQVSGNLFAPGGTHYPTYNAYQPTPGAGFRNVAVVSLLDPGSSTILFSTFLGGERSDRVHAMAIDATGVYAVGETTALLEHQTDMQSFPTSPGAAQEDHEAPLGDSDTDAFAVKYDRSGDRVYATLIGGSDKDRATAVAVDGAGRAWVKTVTDSSDFPACGNPASPAGPCPAGTVPIGNMYQGSSDVGLVQVSDDGSRFLYGTYIGGSGSEDVRSGGGISGGINGGGVALDPLTDEVVVFGASSSSNLPMNVPSAVFPTPNGSIDGFVYRFDPATAGASVPGSIGFTTYLGSGTIDNAAAVMSDDLGNLYMTGAFWGNSSRTYPATPQALQPTHTTTDWNQKIGYMAIIGRLGPDAVVRATSGVLQESSDAPQPTPGIPEVTPLSGEPVHFDTTLSVGGDLPLNTSRSEWTLYAADGATILATDVGAAPAWDGIALSVDEQRYVCVRVWNEGPWPGAPTSTRDLRGHGDFHDSACIHVEWQNRPPVADLWGPPKVPVDVAVAFTDLSTDPDGSIRAWSWDFGEGGTSTDAAPVHVFSATGTYEVALTVTDAHNATHRTTRMITVVDGPVAGFTYPAGDLLMKEPVAFQDASLASLSPIETWTWDFGDGSAPVVHQGEVPSGFAHTFDAAGNYSITLTIFDGNSTDEVVHNVLIVEPEPLPEPDTYRAFLGEDLKVPASQGVLANDRHTGNWPLTVASHDKADHGFVAVTDDGAFTYTPPKEFVGTDTFTYHATDGHTPRGPVLVEVDVVSGVPAQADFHFVVSGDTVFFQDRSVRGDVPIVAWRWTFSDGTEAHTQNAHHAFAPGHHRATLHVTDAAGATSSVTKDVHLLAVDGRPVSGGGPRQAPAPAPETTEAAAVSVEVENRPPTAVADGPEQALPGKGLRLDGSRSSDPDKDALSFRWRQVQGPPVTLADADQAEPSFTASRPGLLVFELTVSDGQAADTAEVPVAVVVAEGPAFEVEILEDGTHWFNATHEGTWSLGDGATATGASVAHRFARPGTYAVRLEADGVESVQWVRVAAEEEPADPEAAPVVAAEPENAQASSVPEPRVPTAVAATAAGVGLLFLLIWAYRTWALVWVRVFTRVGKPDLLEHPLRSQIHDVVQDRPGIVLSDLVTLLGKGRRTVLHHVGMLEGAGMLVVDREGGYVSLHPAGTSGAGVGPETVLRSTVARRLLRITAATPGTTVGELAKQIGVNPSTVSYHVARLEAAGLVEKVREGRITRLFQAAEAV